MKWIEKRFNILLCIVALLSSCSDYTSEQLIEDAKYCTDNGFDYQILDKGPNSAPIGVACKKK
jgi:hypothetical protein